MLSHPALPQSEPEETVAAATSSLLQAAENQRRPLGFREFIDEIREFFHSWFIEGPIQVLHGHFSKRAAGFMIACAMPAILAVIFITLPGLLFQTPEHHAYFYFAKFVQGDSASNLPVLLGAITSLFSFRFPLGG
jgi:hypothetical protein